MTTVVTSLLSSNPSSITLPLLPHPPLPLNPPPSPSLTPHPPPLNPHLLKFIWRNMWSVRRRKGRGRREVWSHKLLGWS